MKKIPFLILFAVLALTSLAENATFNIATYNIRQANHSDSVAGNGWGRREPHVASLIRFHQFDIFGTQEGASVPGGDSATNLPDGNFSTSISTWIMSAPWPAPKAPV